LEIPLNAKVECTDGVFGRSEYVLINPVTDQVTHLVVKDDSSPNTEYIVPVDSISKTLADTIQLRCSKADLKKMKPFMKTEFIEENVPPDNLGGDEMYGTGTIYYYPYIVSDTKIIESVTTQQIPMGELAIRRGSRVEASDGYVGKVDEFVVHPESSHMTHLVMRDGHLWGHRDVIIPLTAIESTYEDHVYLNLDKKQIESLSSFPVKRRWS
jgi:uncharacterized protein YrrD